MPARVLVTGACTFFAARLIHDLGRRGARVTAADSFPLSAGKMSRYVSRRLRVPSVAFNTEGFLESVLAELRTRSYDLLLPTFEESLLLAEYQDELRRYTRLCLPDFATMCRLHHKPSLHELCLKLDLPTPPTLVVPDVDHLRLVREAMGFPVVLKLPACNNAVGRTYCDDEDALRRNFTRLADQQRERGAEPPFVQKRIRGPMICTLSYGLQGRKLAEVVYRTGRMFPQAGGTAAHRQSIVHSKISRINDRLIAATGWTGFLGLDFLEDQDSGVPYLIDANTRANPAIHLGFKAGLDWSQIILDLARDRVPNVQISQPGINVHTLLIDLAWLLEGLSPGGGGLLNFPRRFAEFLSPPWPVHSRDDLLTIGEFGAALVVAAQAISTGVKSVFTGRQAGHLLLEHANYDMATAAALRTKRSPETRERIAA